MPLLVPNIERSAGDGVAELEDQLDLLLHVEPEAAVLLGDGEAVEADVLGALADVVGDLVVLLDQRSRRGTTWSRTNSRVTDMISAKSALFTPLLSTTAQVSPAAANPKVEPPA